MVFFIRLSRTAVIRVLKPEGRLKTFVLTACAVFSDGLAAFPCPTTLPKRHKCQAQTAAVCPITRNRFSDGLAVCPKQTFPTLFEAVCENIRPRTNTSLSNRSFQTALQCVSSARLPEKETERPSENVCVRFSDGLPSCAVAHAVFQTALIFQTASRVSPYFSNPVPRR